jgi:hypothetical protein
VKWKAIETAPTDGTHVLLRYRWAQCEVYISEGWAKRHHRRVTWNTPHIVDVRPLQWMPLPA